MMKNVKYGILSICALVLLSAGTAFGQYKSHVPLIIEVTGAVNKNLDNKPLLKICDGLHISLSAVYQWKNHLVIYDVPSNARKLEKSLAAAYPNSTVKEYAKTYYHFDRKQHCKASTVAKEWTNILLTANLVKDAKLQQEYLSYHATQFQKWPEVSRGFCNADFQQLLGYKNGRQLILVISIPKGKTLDELNPKTTENNPRVDKWNNLMKKYQEGLTGTKPGEVWVFLQPVKTR